MKIETKKRKNLPDQILLYPENEYEVYVFGHLHSQKEVIAEFDADLKMRSVSLSAPMLFHILEHFKRV